MKSTVFNKQILITSIAILITTWILNPQIYSKTIFYSDITDSVTTSWLNNQLR